MKNIRKTYKYIIALLLALLISYLVYKGYIEEAILTVGSDESKNNIKVNFNIDFRDALKITALGGSATAMIKACPPQSRPMVTGLLGTLAAGSYVLNNYMNRFDSNNEGGGKSIISSTDIKINKLIESDDYGKGTSKSVLDYISDIWTIIKEKVLGAPIRCDDSSWNPVDIVDQLLKGFSIEQKFCIVVIVMLLVVLYVSIGIMLSIITRLIFNKPFENKYLEKIRILYSQSNNVTLIVLFIMQLYGISYSIYALCIYVKLKGIRCDDSSWNPLDNINDLLIYFSEEQKFFIGVILLLIGGLYSSIMLMLSVLTRLIFNKPFENKYLEKIRIWHSQSNNVLLIVLFIMQFYGISYAIYGLCVYNGLIYYS